MPATMRGRLCRAVAAAWVLTLPLSAWSDVLAGWDVNSLAGGANAFGASPLAAGTADANVTVGGLTRGSGVGTTGAAAARGWGGTTWNATSASAAASAAQVITFSLTAKPGYLLSLSGLSRLDYRRSSGGPTAGVLQVQVGSAAFTDVASLSYSSTASAGASLAAVDLSGIASLQGVTAGTVVTVRIVNYGASTAGGTWYLFDTANSTAADLEVSGSTAPAGPAVDGVCGASAGLTFATAPAANLCATGAASAVTANGAWGWSCAASNGGRAASCSAVNTSATGC
jgi:hypothetical protein